MVRSVSLDELNEPFMLSHRRESLNRLALAGNFFKNC